MKKNSPLTRLVKPYVHSDGKVELTPNGLQFSRASTMPRNMKGGGIRGKVEGFSLASARRLRETLFRADFHPEGMGVIGICLTLPKEAEVGVGEEVWDGMRKHRGEFEGLAAAVWRKEVQRNGREHYHVVIWTEGRNPLAVAGDLVQTWCRLVSRRCGGDDVQRRMLWTHCRGNDGWFAVGSEKKSPEQGAVRSGGSTPVPTAPESEGDAHGLNETSFRQIADSMPCLTRIDSQGQGVRYLVDHSSKHKAHQAKTTGRPWGVWGRNRLPRLPDSSSVYARLSPLEEIQLARILRHLSRYWVRCPCVFGWRWCRGRKFAVGKHIVADAMARDAVRRWLERKGIIDRLLFEGRSIGGHFEQPELPLG